MTKEKMEKKIVRQMRFRFWIAVLVSFIVIAAASLIIRWSYENIFSQEEEVLDSEAADLIEKIDDIKVKGNKMVELKKIRASYEELSEESKLQVTKERYDKVLEAIGMEETMRETGNDCVVRDKSRNGYDLDFGTDTEAMLKRDGGKTGFEGQTDVRGKGADETFHRLFSGTNHFTIEADINPNGWGYTDADYNMIVSKGDNCTAFRVSGQNLYFFIKNTDGNWIAAMLKLTDEQMNSWIHVAGIYNGKTVSVYLEGRGMKASGEAGEVAVSDYPFSIGYCPETGRISTVGIRKLHVYSQALTEEELDKRSYSLDSESVVLWYDFDEYIYSGVVSTDVKGIRSYTDSVKITEDKKEKILTDLVPYYAQGDIIYSVDKEEVAAVSEDGTVTGVKAGSAVVTAAVQGTDFQIKIPVTVRGSSQRIRQMLEWFVRWMILIDVTAFCLCLFVIILIQRRQLMGYLIELANSVSLIGKNTDEAELSPILREAQNMIREVEDSFRQKDYAAREAEQRKNDLVVYLAHDLKTPIASIIGYLTLLRDEKQISPELHQHYVETALNNSERLDDLINEFFEITRFNISQITLGCREINLTWLLEQLVSEFRPMLVEKGLTCRLDIQQNVHLRCDPDKLERVFDNLLRNAINYSFPNTEICITMAVEEKVILTCTNHGETIPEEKLERIFEQFYRLDSARSSGTGGSGLGLAIAKQIVELHHGEIRAESKDGIICFTVILPLNEKEKDYKN